MCDIYTHTQSPVLETKCQKCLLVFDYFLDYIYIVDLAFDSHQQASGKITMTFIAMLSVCKLPTTTSCCGWKFLVNSLLFVSWLNFFFFFVCFCLFLMS